LLLGLVSLGLGLGRRALFVLATRGLFIQPRKNYLCEVKTRLIY
jgi:hypothetical protein